MKLDCTNKRRLFYVGTNEKTGKNLTKIYGVGVNYVGFDGVRYIPLDKILPADKYRFKRIYSDYEIIPCGSCIACRLRQSAEYANRGVMESDYHDTAYFLTLTYDDEHLPRKEYIDSDGVVQTFNTLDVKHLQDFKKLLRYHNDCPMTFLDCGEYGSRTLRPHYHLICWDLKIDDLKPLPFVYSKQTILQKGKSEVNFSKFKYYTSDKIRNMWKKGHIVITEVNFATIAYVCRYNLKKSKNNLQPLYDLTGITPEFRHFPKRPALGQKYFEDHYHDIYKNDEVIHSGFRFKTIRPPKYFDRLLEKADSDLYNKIKAQRKVRFDSSEFDDISYSDLRNFDSQQENLSECISEAVKFLKGGGI